MFLPFKIPSKISFGNKPMDIPVDKTQPVIQKQFELGKGESDLASNQQKLGEFASGAFGQAVGAPLKAGIQAGVMPLAEGLGLRKEGTPYQPSGSTQEFLLGKELLKSISSQMMEKQMEGAKSNSYWDKAKSFAGVAGVAGETMIDVIPAVGEYGQISKGLAKKVGFKIPKVISLGEPTLKSGSKVVNKMNKYDPFRVQQFNVGGINRYVHEVTARQVDEAIQEINPKIITKKVINGIDKFIQYATREKPSGWSGAKVEKDVIRLMDSIGLPTNMSPAATMHFLSDFRSQIIKKIK